VFASRASSCGSWRGVWWYLERRCSAKTEGFKNGARGFVVVEDAVGERGFVGERSGNELDRRCFGM
jgi:hypothetical protein